MSQIDVGAGAGVAEASIDGTLDNMLHNQQAARASGPLAAHPRAVESVEQSSGAAVGNGGAGSLLHREPSSIAGNTSDADSAGAEPSSAESLNLNIPADVQNSITTEQIEAFSQYAAAMGWNTTQAQAALDYQVQNGRAAQSVFERQLSLWEGTVRADPQLGGSNLGTTVSTANKAMQHFDPTGTISSLLKSSGQGSNPDVVRFLYKVGLTLGEDRVPLAGNAQHSKLPLAERMYPNFKF